MQLNISNKQSFILTVLKPGNPRTDTCDTERQAEKKETKNKKD